MLAAATLVVGPNGKKRGCSTAKQLRVVCLITREFERFIPTSLLWNLRDVTMIVTRWQASVLPTQEQISLIFAAEGLNPQEEVLPAKRTIADHRHPFDEVRMVISGDLLMNISGNQILLRAGDRIDIPANTRHAKTANGNEDCVCVVAQKPF